MIIGIFLLYIFVFLFYNYYWKRRKFPPGPTPLPLYGNVIDLLQRNPHPHLIGAWQKWTKEYGPIFTYWLGEDPIVIVTEYSIIKELFAKAGNDYAGRSFMDPISNFLTDVRGIYGLVRTEGEEWQQLRRFSLHAMRNLGMGRNRIEQKSLIEMNLVYEIIKKEKSYGKEIHDLPRIVDRFTGSIANILIFGSSLDENSMADFLVQKKKSREILEAFATMTALLVMQMPWLRFFPVFSDTFKYIDERVTILQQFCNKEIRQKMEEMKNSKTKLDPERDEESDFITIFLKKMELEANERERNLSLGYNYFDMKALESSAFDLHFAAQTTTANTLIFLLIFVLLDQRVQKKMHQELDALAEQTGRWNESTAENDPVALITSADRTKLPYINAVINENFRYCNLFPGNLFRRTTTDIKLGDYTLSKGTLIVPQLSCIFFDKNIYEEPDKFIPERFLETDGSLKKSEEIIPFGIGKRVCMGEALARMSIFIFIANFFDKYEILPVDPRNPPSAEKQPGFQVLPIYFKCKIQHRKRNL